MIRKISIVFIFALVLCLFFNKVLLKGYVPFPGDLLVGNYEPYKSEFVGIPHKDQGADVIRELYPWKFFTIESIKNGFFPMWDPYILSGNPHFANLQSGTLYPLNLFFFVLPFIDAWSVYIVSQYVLAFSFMYLYLRQIRLSIQAAFFGAIVFSFSAFFSVWGEYGNVGHSLAFFPLILYAVEKVLEEKKRIWLILLPLSITLSIFAGYIQLILYFFILSIFYIYFRSKSNKKIIMHIFKIYFLLCLGFLISGIQSIPLLELFNNSLRINYSYKDLLEIRLMPLQNVVTLLIPDFFGNPATRNYFLQGSSLERASNIGILPLFFAVFAFFGKKSFYKIFFICTALIAYVFTLSIPPVAFFHSIGIPFLSTGVPTRLLSVFVFSCAVLSAIGIEEFLLGKSKKKIIYLFGIFSFFLGCLFIFTYVVHDQNFLISRRNIVLPALVFFVGIIFSLFTFNKKFSVVLVITLTIFELFYSFQKFNSFVPRQFIYPQTSISKKLKEIQGQDRYWGYGSANIDANFQIIEGNYSTDGYDPLLIKKYGEFLSASENGKIPQEVPRSVANIFKGYGVNDLKTNFFRKRALDLTSVKYVLNKNENKGIDSAFSEKDFKLIWEDKGWQIYENLGSLPRVKLFGDYIIEPDSKKVLKMLYSSDFDYKNKVILETDLSFSAKPDPTAEAKIVSYKPNEIIVHTKSNKPQFLFISDNYFPGWHANINNAYFPSLISANYTYKAIPVPAGKNTVKLYFAPISFWIGFWVTVLSILSLIVLTVSTKIKRT